MLVFFCMTLLICIEYDVPELDCYYKDNHFK